jgi:hypothetical protein
MVLNLPGHSTRPLTLVLLAAFAGLALWLFIPWGNGGGSTSGGSESSPAQLPSMLTRSGDVVIETDGDDITRIEVPVSLRGDDPIDITAGVLRAETALAETALAAVPATYSVEWQAGNGDALLEAGETALLVVDLPAGSGVRESNPLDLVLKLENGPTLVIEDVLAR